jgi:hypothetical protein
VQWILRGKTRSVQQFNRDRLIFSVLRDFSDSLHKMSPYCRKLWTKLWLLHRMNTNRLRRNSYQSWRNKDERPRRNETLRQPTYEDWLSDQKVAEEMEYGAEHGHTFGSRTPQSVSQKTQIIGRKDNIHSSCCITALCCIHGCVNQMRGPIHPTVPPLLPAPSHSSPFTS